MLTSKELQELLQVDRSTIYRMAEAGSLPAVKVGRQWRFPEAAIERWLISGHQGTGRPRAVEPDDGAALAPSSCIQPIIDLLADILGVMLVVTDMHGVPITDVSNPCGLFDAVAQIPGGTAECIAGWQDLAGSADLEPRFTGSHLGLMCARSFIRVGAELKAMVIAGGIAPGVWPPSDAELDSMAQGFGADSADLAAHVGEVYDLDANARQRVLEALPRVAAMISEISAEFRSLRGKLEAIAVLTERSTRS
ncbi:helix-turn-helix domain protein [bacterium BMS3Abin02]|nr:helix-turn-helix domain protein [bacterium BMS3Abin02]GBE21447.1 helix-turn-helix domain protein [bacterium BMS3Bbin01]HDH26506.1 helix-turn-helix domain-containing protein [Actinomycetota bacterium]